MKALTIGALRHDAAVVRPQAGGLAMGAKALAALPQKPTPAPDASERQPYNGGIIGGLPRDEPMSTPREQELDTQIRTNLADNPDALAAYEDLLETDALRGPALAAVPLIRASPCWSRCRTIPKRM